MYESAITARDEPGFGESKLALGVIKLPVTARDRIPRCSPPVACWDDASQPELEVPAREGTLEFLGSINKYGERDRGNYPYYRGRGTN